MRNSDRSVFANLCVNPDQELICARFKSHTMQGFHRAILTFLLCTFLAYIATCQELPITDVILIGTKHNPNPVYNSDSLMKAVVNLNPDVILIEQDSTSYTFKRGTFRRMPDWSVFLMNLFKRNSLQVEGTMLYRYHHEFPRIIIKPCDVAFNGAERERYRESYLKLEENFSKAMSRAYDNKEMSAYREKVHTGRRELISQLWQLLDNGKLEDFNSDSSTQLIRDLETLDAVHFSALVDSVPSLKAFAERVHKGLQHARYRDEVMVQQILRFVHEFRGKRIVVITGALHRYFQLDHLAPKTEQYHFRLLSITGKEMSIKAM